MAKRKIVEIEEENCNGCGECIPNCHEGALQIIDGKAKLVDEVYCDGLGNCLGHCPQDAIKIVEKDVEDFDYKATNEHLKSMGREELKENPLEESIKDKPDLPCGCPGTMVQDLREDKKEDSYNMPKQKSELKQWPIQLHLLPPNASFFNDSDLLIAADCTGFAYPNIHSRLLKGKSVVIGCPKLDDLDTYKDRIKGIIEHNNLKSITVAIMEVPCCYGMYQIVEEAIEESNKDITLTKKIISISGDSQ